MRSLRRPRDWPPGGAAPELEPSAVLSPVAVFVVAMHTVTSPPSKSFTFKPTSDALVARLSRLATLGSK